MHFVLLYYNFTLLIYYCYKKQTTIAFQMEVTQKIKNVFQQQLQLKIQSKIINQNLQSTFRNQFNLNSNINQLSQQTLKNKQTQNDKNINDLLNQKVQQTQIQNYIQQYFKSKQHVFPQLDVQLINKKIKMLQKLFFALNQKTDIKAYLLQYYSMSFFFKNILTQLQHYPAINITSDDKKEMQKKQFYIGQLQANKKHGYGLLATAYYSNVQKDQKKHENQLKHKDENDKFLLEFYQGSFNNDKKNGFGKQYKNNKFYIGRFINDRQTSKFAVVLYKNLNIYVGEIVNNLKNGFGFLYVSSIKNQTYYQFFLKNNFQLFKQILISKWNDGEPKDLNKQTNYFPTKMIGYNYIYQGQVCFKKQTEQFVKNGKGRQVYLQGDAYEGQFKDNMIHGQGKYIWKNGNCYIGQFQNGFRHGQGYWKQKKTDDQYEGKYKLNKREGEGFYKWGNGNFYFGCFKQNLRHGKGKMQWLHGQIYNGYWENGFQNGKGQIWLRQGTQIRFIRESVFLNGIQLEKVNSSITKKNLKSRTKQKYQDKSIELLTNKKIIKIDHKKHKSQFTSSLDNKMPKIKKYYGFHTEPIQQIINDKKAKNKQKQKLIKNQNSRQSLIKETLREKQKQDHNKTKKILYKPTKIKVYTEISQSKNFAQSQQISQNSKNAQIKQIRYLPKIQGQNFTIFKKDSKQQIFKLQNHSTIQYSQNQLSNQYKDIKKPLNWKGINRKHFFCYKTNQLIQK